MSLRIFSNYSDDELALMSIRKGSREFVQLLTPDRKKRNNLLIGLIERFREAGLSDPKYIDIGHYREREARQRGERLARQREERLVRQREERLARQREERLVRQREERLVRQREERLVRQREERLASDRQREERIGRQHAELVRLDAMLIRDPIYRPPMTLANAYLILGLSGHENARAVKQAYMKLSMTHHTDKIRPDDPERLLKMAKYKYITSAYNMITESK